MSNEQEADAQYTYDTIMELRAEVKRLRAETSDDAAQKIATRVVAEIVTPLRAERDELSAALHGMIDEWEKLSRYGSPMAKAANERVNRARAAIVGRRSCQEHHWTGWPGASLAAREFLRERWPRTRPSLAPDVETIVAEIMVALAIQLEMQGR